MAADSSKEEEIDAICKARNVPASASNAEKLKALDQEYHYLIETHQNVKAEQIQLLYQFKAKKIISVGFNSCLNKLIRKKILIEYILYKKEGKSGSKMSESGNYIFQANLKYLDGFSLILANNQTIFNAFFTLGRSFCLIGDYQQALSYLQNCINWSDNKFRTLSR